MGGGAAPPGKRRSPAARCAAGLRDIGVVSDGDYSAHFFTIMLALWPPKPKVLESA